jgi:hypothetical protein
MATAGIEQLFSTQEHDLLPPIPETIEECGLPETMVEQLIVMTLYFRSETVGRD